MGEQASIITSSAPAAAFLLPLVSGIVLFLASGLGRRFQQWVSVLTAALVTGLGAWMASRVANGVVLTTWNDELRVDALSALMVVIIGGIGMLVLVGIGLGTYLGCYGGLFHLLNHALYKSCCLCAWARLSLRPALGE